jgi:hypothetical protein
MAAGGRTARRAFFTTRAAPARGSGAQPSAVSVTVSGGAWPSGRTIVYRRVDGWTEGSSGYSPSWQILGNHIPMVQAEKCVFTLVKRIKVGAGDN